MFYRAGRMVVAENVNFAKQAASQTEPGVSVENSVGPIPEGKSRMSVTAFLTDSTLCIGCKACEVACKEWNQLESDGFDWKGFSYDNTGELGHSTWRHVKFVEGGVVPG